MVEHGSNSAQEPPDAVSVGVDRSKRLRQWLRLQGYVLRGSGLKMLRVFRLRGRMKAVDLNKLVEPYLDSGLYLAVKSDNTSVVATGKTSKDAGDQAAARGCSEPVIMRAPSREAMENSLHL
jgi:hypothetical protein